MKDILTLKELASYLKLSKSKLYAYVQQGKIPASKVGRLWRFRKSRINAWLDKQES